MRLPSKKKTDKGILLELYTVIVTVLLCISIVYNFQQREHITHMWHVYTNLQMENVHLQKVIDDERTIFKLYQKCNIMLREKLNSYKEVKVTAYVLPGTTASGEKVKHGIVAVSRDLHKEGWTFGRRVHILGSGTYRIADLMGPNERRSL